MQSDYARYLVIRVTGLVERAIEEIVLAHTKAQASTSVTAHVSWRMKVFQNPSTDRILQLVGSFDKQWGASLKDELTVGEKEALGSLGAQRNQIAHGGTSTISLGQVASFYEHVKTLLAKVAGTFS